MKLPPGKPTTDGLDRMRLTEHVAKRHGSVVGPSARRGKLLLVSALACGVWACGPEAHPVALTGGGSPATATVSIAPSSAPMGSASSNGGPSFVLKSPVDEARRALSAARAATDPHERCRWLLEATLLDPSSKDAHKARAESRCAPAAELLPNARALFALDQGSAAAVLLGAVAMRAHARADALAAAATLERLEVPDRLTAAQIYASMGEQLRAAKVYEGVAAAREAKGATTDALDARLDAVIATARAGKPAAASLTAVLASASSTSKGYGDAWVGPKVVEAIAAVRNGGEDVAAVAAKAAKSGLFAAPTPREAFAIERAIAAARAGEPAAAQALAVKVAARAHEPAARALLAVIARVTGSCADAQAHGRAHAGLSPDGLRLDDDVAWARACVGAAEVRPTVVAPVASDEVSDMRAIADADPLHARARLEAIVKAHPEDVAAWLASIDLAATYDRAKVIARAVAALPRDPWIRFAELSRAQGAAQLTLARSFVATVLPKTIEATVPRGVAPMLARLMELPASDDAGFDELAEALVASCAVGVTSACLEPARAPALGRATANLRKRHWKLLAKRGVALSPADLAVAHVRLDVALALIKAGDAQKGSLVAAKLAGPDGALARASVAAAQGKCAAAQDAKEGATSLEAEYADAFAAVRAKCK
jgi:hypothetical protein